MKEFITAVENAAQEADGVEEPFTEFKLDGRHMKAYKPNEGQLTFMMAAMGRGQTTQQRYGAIINIMMASLRDDDADYFENRLLSRDPKECLKIKQIEPIFEYLTEEWFRDDAASNGETAGASV